MFHISVAGTFPLAMKRRNRVEIQVFRGANNEEEQYAPWGFIIRQPSDLPTDSDYY